MIYIFKCHIHLYRGVGYKNEQACLCVSIGQWASIDGEKNNLNTVRGMNEDKLINND
jgi:hypothetical protein